MAGYDVDIIAIEASQWYATTVSLCPRCCRGTGGVESMVMITIDTDIDWVAMQVLVVLQESGQLWFDSQ